MAEASTTPSATSNDNVLAAVATIPVVGAIIYYGMKDSSEFVKFYAKQSVILTVVSLVSMVVGFIPILGWIIAPLVSLVVFVAWIILAINALQGAKYRLPVVADLADQYVK